MDSETPADDRLTRFKSWLVREGYQASTRRNYEAIAGHWLAQDAGWALDEKQVAAFARRRRRKRGGGREVRQALHALRRHLQGDSPAAPADDDVPVLGDFARWMTAQRGVVESTLVTYRAVLAAFLSALGGSVSALDAGAIRAFVLERARRHPRQAGGVRTAIRMFLRFLASVGRVDPVLVDAVPAVAGWRLSTLPRALEPSKVQRLLDSCDARTITGSRDRAVLFLLAHLGLRAGEVARLQLCDIDWTGATFVLARSKGRRGERLPLPQQDGDAILAWLRHRPLAADGRVFLRLRPPFVALGSHGIADIVARAMSRADVDSPSRGAHQLRHSAATRLLREGASLHQIGALLRHRSPDTTALYAKVDVRMLAEVAQPWPHSPPC